jgi:hypothetical protein
MNTPIETTMYQPSQVFLLPTLVLIAALLFVYAFWVLGEFGCWPAPPPGPAGFAAGAAPPATQAAR